MSFNVVMLWLPFWKRFFIVQGVAIRKPRPKDTFWGKGRTCRRILQGLGCERPRQLGGIFEANLRWICSCQRDFICMIWLKNIEEYHLRPCEKSHWSKAVGTLWGGFLWLSVLGTSSSSASTYSKDKAEHIRQVIDVFEMYLDDLTKFNKIWQVTVTSVRATRPEDLPWCRCFFERCFFESVTTSRTTYFTWVPNTLMYCHRVSPPRCAYIGSQEEGEDSSTSSSAEEGGGLRTPERKPGSSKWYEGYRQP